ncbi:ABC transporter ATP-binding protein [Xanthobacter sp. KR7-225]|uniref:ABC transporter ATP-binding protein n=1 Tax=Xanthobacter sp. KR7-225 TaxID=3156613 RepID=UPI0032B3990D
MSAAPAPGATSAGAPLAGAPLIRAENLSRVISGEVPATLITGANLSVDAGAFIAITGPSGSGKSSLLYLLGLLDLPTTGEVYVEGRATSRLSEDARAALRLEKLGFVFQFHFLLPEFTALDNVLLPMRARGRLKPQAMDERAHALLAALGLEDHGRKRPDQLSGGQRQRVAIARALANDPAVLLADEPTGNLDTHSTEQVFAILRRLVDEERRAVVIVTHDLALAARADRQVRVVDGRIVEGVDEGVP